MEGLEIVNVRLADGKAFEDASTFCRELLTRDLPGWFQIYRGIGPGTDLGVHIHWSFASCSPEKSLLGLQLARGLNEYGLVSHSVWIMQTTNIPDDRSPASQRRTSKHE